MSYVGDFRPGKVVQDAFTTVSTTGSVATFTGTPIFTVYKDNLTTESGSGITVTVDFDSRTGFHHVLIDTSQNSSFYTSGSEFFLTILAGTVSGESLGGYVLTHFSLDNRNPRGIGKFVVGTSSTTTVLSTTSMTPTCTKADQFKGRILIFDEDTTTAALRGQATDITANTTGGTLTVSTLTDAPASGDRGIIV